MCLGFSFRRRRRLGAWLFWAACSLASPALRAQAAPNGATGNVEGNVIGLDGSDVVVDIAGTRGARSGDIVELWRPLTVKHPVTGELISDRFRTGRLRLVQVRDALSLARPEGKLARPAAPGDIVVLLRPFKSEAEAAATWKAAPGAAPPSAPPAPPSAAGGVGACAPDADAAQVSALFDSLRGKDAAARAAAYEGYAQKAPSSRFAAVLREEAKQLRLLLALEAAEQAVPSERTTRFELPREAIAGTALHFGVELGPHAAGAVLHSRHEGEVAYVTTPMRPAGYGYHVVRIPEDRLEASSFQYFIEATAADGKSHAVVGDAAEPVKLAVAPIPRSSTPKRPPAVVSLSTDYADWNNLRGNDVVWQSEGYVGIRLHDVGVRAVRSGFGVYRGIGGSLRELDDLGLSARKVGLTYGYLEGEWGVTHFTGLVGRAIVGLEDGGITGGAQAFVRLGNDDDTNLLLGGEALGSIGLRGITQLELDVFERFPILLRTEVTNQPAGSRAGASVRPAEPNALPEQTSTAEGEIGARIIAQLGYRVLPTLELAVRTSYQGRTINHAGPGAGAGVTYQW